MLRSIQNRRFVWAQSIGTVLWYREVLHVLWPLKKKKKKNLFKVANDLFCILHWEIIKLTRVTRFKVGNNANSLIFFHDLSVAKILHDVIDMIFFTPSNRLNKILELLESVCHLKFANGKKAYITKHFLCLY